MGAKIPSGCQKGLVVEVAGAETGAAVNTGRPISLRTNPNALLLQAPAGLVQAWLALWPNSVKEGGLIGSKQESWRRAIGVGGANDATLVAVGVPMKVHEVPRAGLCA